MDLPTCLTSNVTPLQLPIQNNAISTDGYGSTKGVALTIGDPPQFFSVQPVFTSNNTWVALSDYCEGTANYSCMAYYGGIYTRPDGVTTTTTADAWNGTSDGSLSYSRNIFYNDDSQIGGRDIPGMPFFSYYYEAGDFTNPSALALGINSSFIDAAAEAGIVPNKQYSIWPGNNYLELNGLLVVGGYDKDRVGGQFETFEVQYSTTVVDITGLAWESNGVSTSLMPNGTTTLLGLLDPYADYITMPTDSMNLLILASNTIYDPYYSYIYNSSFAPAGNLVVTLSNGKNTTIPGDDLYKLPQEYDDRGFLQVTNDSIQQIQVYPQGPDEGFLWLGLPFMTQKIFVSDFDQGLFYMADAVKQDFGSKASNLQALCTGGPTPANNTNTTVPTPPESTDTGGGGSNAAAIGGGVGGGIGGLLLIGAIAFFFTRRRKKQKAKDNEALQYTPEISEPKFQGTPPPKYPNVYETNGSSEKGAAIVQPLYVSRSTTPGVLADHNEYSSTAASRHGGSETHELDSEGRCAATSGPMDMPAEYDQRWT